MIYIERLEYEKIINQAKKEFPNECCGFLAGNKKEEDVFIKVAYPLFNTDQSSEHFSMDPKEQFKTVKIIRENKMELIGNYHSHPYTPSRPSEEDKKLAFDPRAIYGILSLEKEKPVFNLFKVDKGNVEKLKYEII
ncbi:M67 family metallopeptidase [Clostridium sp.]|jgi:proteasome lid subunit RPN8/RPN11|uniref:M67 family metallopeptidase n=1 Tax=Clostridium sp. TaxID=1506 RepID=UPI00258AB8A6|nr:M67 family metallopeptidase [Clostridium sp.]MDF2503479.1 putative metal-dependent protease superfamily [Clostridium sp.]